MQAHLREDCRLCGGMLNQVFELKPTPIANSFPDKPDSGATKFPLELMQCAACGHVQLHHVITGLFEDYKYVTPQIVNEYMEPYARELREKFPYAERVMEIGCNAGGFTEILKRQGFQAYGIDPAAPLRVGYYRNYFNLEWAKQYPYTYDLIIANNCLAHIDDLTDVFKGIAMLLKGDGTLIFEVQYLPDLINAGRFDMIYHEHMSYHTLAPLRGFLLRFGLKLVDWSLLPAHGGSVRVYCSRGAELNATVDERLRWPLLYDAVGKIPTWEGKIPGFGAPAKATTLIHQWNLQDKISYVVDDTPQKQGKFIPGTGIPIYPTSFLDTDRAYLFAWNFRAEIEAKYPGVKFL